MEATRESESDDLAEADIKDILLAMKKEAKTRHEKLETAKRVTVVVEKEINNLKTKFNNIENEKKVEKRGISITK